MKNILMFSGVPGAGKTTLLAEVQAQMRTKGAAAVIIEEYRHVSEWAHLSENSHLVRIVGKSFDLFPAAYVPMSEQVADVMGRRIAALFGEGAATVAFEIARGVGKPLADYVSFVDGLSITLGEWKSLAQLANIEVVAQHRDIEERMIARYEADPSAPPPGIERKYLDSRGLPLIFATEDLARERLAIPLVFNEMIRNGRNREMLRLEVERELYPRLASCLELAHTDEEGRLRGAERFG